MEVININLDDIKCIGNLSLCLGYFDAFHLGHLALIKKAKEQDGKVGLLTMEPNPKSFFTNKDVKCINSFEDKCEILKALGVDYFIILKTEERLLNLSPEEFIDQVVVPLGTISITCGFDYTFGKDRKGNPSLLKMMANTRCFNVNVIEEVTNKEGEKISTTLIQDLISRGEIEKANSYLYEPYTMCGHVGHGNHIGNTFGYATANIEVSDSYLYPKRGVYAGKCFINDKEYIAMINIGNHPTVGEASKYLIEAHILDFNNDIYGYDIRVRFEYFIRDEIKFDSISSLVEQLKKDETKIRSLNYRK